MSTNEWKTLVNILSFGIFYKERQTVTITAEDEGSGVDKVSYFLTSSDTLMNQTALAALPESKWTLITNGSSFVVNSDNKYVIYAKITDKSGNVTYISTDGIVLDKTAPIITGIENNKTYCEGVTFTVSDANGLASVMIDDTEQATGGSYTIAASGVKATHTIVACDVAGNKTTCTITINANGEHIFGDWKVTTPATCEEDGVESRTCSTCGLVQTQKINKSEHQYIIDSDHAHFFWTAKIEDGVMTGYDATAYFVCENEPSHILYADQCYVTLEETKKPTQDEEGRVTYIASVTYGDKTDSAERITTLAKLVKLDSTDSSNSNIYTSTSVAENAPSTKIDAGLTVELAEDLMTPAELASYKSETVATDVTLYLEVQSITSVVNSDDEKKVEEQISDLVTVKANADTVEAVQSGAEYLNLSMYKKVKTEEKDGEYVIAKSENTTKITDTQSKLTISVEIPEDLRTTVPTGYVRTYHIIRVHNDQAEVLDTHRMGNQLTFETDKFSTYAIAYVDVKDPTVIPPAGNNGGIDYSGGTIIVSQPEKPEEDSEKEDGEEAEKDDSESGKETTATVDTTFRKLHLAEAKASKNVVKLCWRKVAGADGYVLYGAPCNTKDKTYKMKKLAVIKNGSKITYTDKKLKSGTYYNSSCVVI